MAAIAGWYPDPSGGYEFRYWDGSRWTDHVHGSAGLSETPSDAPSVGGAEPVVRTARASVVERRATVETFLDDMVVQRRLDAATRDRLAGELAYWDPDRRPIVAPAVPRAVPASVTSAAPMPVVAPARAPASPPAPPVHVAVPRSAVPPPQPPPKPAVPPPHRPPPPHPAPVLPTYTPTPRPPSAASVWWARRRSTISADLAVHGLAYLGVALVFTGVLGFVIFAFGDVGDTFRPVAELALPLVFFGSAAFLHRRGAPFVSAALEFLGGLLLPIVGVASLVDGADVPPDLDGASLVVALVLMALGFAGAYALVVRRRPRSPLRYLVAPMVWLAVASLGLAFAPEIPGGRDVSRPFSLQWALVAAAVAATLGLSRLRPDGPLARASVVSAIPGAALAAAMTVLAAPRSGWPAGAMVLAGASTLVSIELLAPRLRAQAVTALQAVTVVGTAASLGPQLGGAWAAAAAAIGLLALAEWQAHRRADPIALAALLVGAAGAAAFSFAHPWPTLAVAGVGLVWSVGRRIRPLPGLPGVVPVIGIFGLPVLAATGVARLLPVDTTWLVLSSAVAAVALVVRFSPARRDMVMAVWVPVFAGAVAAFSLAGVAVERPWLAAIASGLAAMAFLLAPRWSCVRVWTTTAAGALTLGWVASAVGWTVATTALVAAGLGTVLVLVALLHRTAVFGHLGLAGHTVAGLALTVALVDELAREAADGPWTGVTTWALALVALGWVVTTTAGEVQGGSVRDLIIRLLVGGEGTEARYAPVEESASTQFGAEVAPLIALLAVTTLVPAVLVTIGVLDWPDPWLAVAAGVVPLGAALAARLLTASRSRLAGVWSVVGVLLVAALAVAASPGLWSAVVAGLAVILVVFLVAPRFRHSWMIWLAWVASATVTLQTAHALGMAGGRLHLALFVWASVVMVGGLALDDRWCGRRTPGQWARRPELRPGVALAMVAAPLALLPVFERSPAEYGWWSMVAAAVAFVVSAQLRQGWVSIIGWALAVVAYGALAPWEPVALPWTLVPVVALLLLAADLANHLLGPSPVPPAVRPDLPPPPGQHPPGAGLPQAWFRWDLPAFLVAHGTAAVALVAALVHGWIPATWISVGALGLAVAARRRTWLWAAGGVALVLVGAAVAGPAWLTLALAVTSVGATVAATRSTDDPRSALQVTGMVAAGGAWASLIWWQVWDTEQVVVATSLGSALVLVLLAAAVRWARLGLDWLVCWVGLPLVGFTVSATLLTSEVVPRSPARLVVGGALAVASVSVALLARPTSWSWLREASVAVLAGAAVVAASAGELSPTTQVVVALGAGLLATGASLILQSIDKAIEWRRPALLFAGAGTGLALVVAAGELPERPLMVVVLLVAAIELAVVGVVARRVEWLIAAVVTATAAWLVYASQALTGDPQWFTVPIGVMLLVVVALARWDRRRAGLSPSPEALVGLDLVGMALVVGSALVQTATESPAFGLLAVALGLGLVAFGVLSRVRRRLVFGAATVALALLLMVVPPLVGLIPGIRGWVPWALLAVVGMVAIFVAAFLEQGRRFVRRTVRRFSELTQGWE